MSDPRLTEPQERILAKVRAQGSAVYNNRARKSLEALERFGLVIVDWGVHFMAKGNGIDTMGKNTVRPVMPNPDDGATFRQLIGARLKRARKAREWSTTDVGELIGMTAKSVENHEHGRVAIPVERYLPVYGMTARELLAQAAVIELRVA